MEVPTTNKAMPGRVSLTKRLVSFYGIELLNIEVLKQQALLGLATLRVFLMRPSERNPNGSSQKTALLMLAKGIAKRRRGRPTKFAEDSLGNVRGSARGSRPIVPV